MLRDQVQGDVAGKDQTQEPTTGVVPCRGSAPPYDPGLCFWAYFSFFTSACTTTGSGLASLTGKPFR